MKQYIVTALVTNKSGVLTRVSGLFSRRGYNINSLSVCATEDPAYSRMTIVAEADESTIKQITRQLDKLIDVKKVSLLAPDKAVCRELLILKLTMKPAERPEIESTCNIYKAKMIDLSPASLIVELTGEPNKIDAFINVVAHYGIIELVRTGLTALSRGEENINDLKDYNDLF
ncbi:MAG: acetolactate synthase small subunit [Clostridiales bacterium]|nr:acetolactate synthase small subunit [Clostridiales bacterium]